MGTFITFIDDIIDILLVSYVIYKLLLIVRGTRAIQLLKGIMVIVVAWLISTYFELRTLQWLMSQAFTYGVLAIIIIFQPELRRALEKLGSGKLFFRVNSMDEQTHIKLVEEIIKAVSYLSKRRIGSLIVIERNTGLSEYIESGVSLNADVTSELLINIFIPNTPLHDGAVIIRKDKIMAAGCYLPLSENPFISKELGTRHRAGIGMTELSDAISLIVSEETGHFSISMNGQIERGLTEKRLKAILLSEIRPTEKNSKSFWYKRWNKDG
ncbi:TIGR00159 family protein [Vulcanibacillus modesticaldus]|uniref:Diadenylate cyclase n=1 Tax=Vulcanibacillus modesticaldus TaxID=337097 RepID=A0A1D2YX34_9BACI|nr:diadenylate cyclase CdaA [Vulcanibacillus modesticaldus]OEG00232.1 TIGR00159 family protein [Vulcanibacillus modesticaldus]